MYHDTGGGKDMRDAIREFEWYYKGRSRRLLKFHLLITTYDDLIKDYEVCIHLLLNTILVLVLVMIIFMLCYAML